MRVVFLFLCLFSFSLSSLCLSLGELAKFLLSLSSSSLYLYIIYILQDPITLEPLSELPGPPFELFLQETGAAKSGGGENASRTRHLFDGQVSFCSLSLCMRDLVCDIPLA